MANIILHEMVNDDGDGLAWNEYKPVIKWKRKFFIFPRRTMSGKYRAGYLYENIQYFRDPPHTAVYATAKEYFVWKMKHNG